MKRSILLLSLLALVFLGGMVGLSLALQAIPEPPPGSPVGLLVGLAYPGGQIVSLGLTIAAGVLVLLASAQRNQRGWLVALLASGVLSVGSLFALAWIYLGPSAPGQLTVTPLVSFASIAGVSLLYGLLMPSGGASSSSGRQETAR